ncbi:hypothetical protein AGMMS49525_15910 [Bacteroidia bacterium]|nr:hypothetical protein AGMMS49525_15910 [Bacteroidia bacterium]
MTPNTYGETAHRTPTWGSLIFVPSFTVDAKGRITAAVTYNVTIPSALASASANGLMSTTQYNLLSGSQTAKTFLAAPNGSAGAPSYRTIVASDVPTLNQNTTGSAGSLATAGTIRISSASTTTYGGAWTPTPLTYTAGGDVVLDTRIRLVTDSTAGVVTGVDYQTLKSLAFVNGMGGTWRGTVNSKISDTGESRDVACETNHGSSYRVPSTTQIMSGMQSKNASLYTILQDPSLSSLGERVCAPRDIIMYATNPTGSTFPGSYHIKGSHLRIVSSLAGPTTDFNSSGPGYLNILHIDKDYASQAAYEAETVKCLNLCFSKN